MLFGMKPIDGKERAMLLGHNSQNAKPQARMILLCLRE